MRLMWPAAVLLAAASLHAAPPSAEKPGPWVSLFDGKTLAGWKRLGGEAPFEARGGTIVGTWVVGGPHTFLATEREFSDFEFECEFRADAGVNSGVQFRSNAIPAYQDGRVHGYQYEIDPTPRALSGGVFDQSRRGWLVPPNEPAAREAWKAKGRAFRAGKWNRLRIECRGPRIRTWLNGEPMADFEDATTLRGFIALQVHNTRDAEVAGRTVAWRKLRVRELE